MSTTAEHLAILKQKTDAEIAALADRHFPSNGSKEKDRDGLVLRNMADVQPVPLRWLWPGVIPAGKLTLLSGDPGLGKSLITLDIVARVTSGQAWPDGSPGCGFGEVLLLSAEDDAADTIRPRLDAAEAITALVRMIEGVRAGKTRRLFNLADDTFRLDQEINSETRLVVIDPGALLLPRSAPCLRGAALRGYARRLPSREGSRARECGRHGNLSAIPGAWG